jgi:hypothetical protein
MEKTIHAIRINQSILIGEIKGDKDIKIQIEKITFSLLLIQTIKSCANDRQPSILY